MNDFTARNSLQGQIEYLESLDMGQSDADASALRSLDTLLQTMTMNLSFKRAMTEPERAMMRKAKELGYGPEDK